MPFGSLWHARGRGHCRRWKPGRAKQRHIAWVRTTFDRGGGQVDRRRARGKLDPYAQESKAKSGRFLRQKLISDHGLLSSYEGQQGAVNGKDSWGAL